MFCLFWKLKEGEILGIAGIDGNGQSEFIEGLTGLRPVESGKIFLNEEGVTLSYDKILGQPTYSSGNDSTI